MLPAANHLAHRNPRVVRREQLKAGTPVGSIGPRCLDKLRRYPAIAPLTSADTETAG
jgi:hypothetical protein